MVRGRPGVFVFVWWQSTAIAANDGGAVGGWRNPILTSPHLITALGAGATDKAVCQKLASCFTVQLLHGRLGHITSIPQITEQVLADARLGPACCVIYCVFVLFLVCYFL